MGRGKKVGLLLQHHDEAFIPRLDDLKARLKKRV
jgi:hypothetical protein